MLLNNVHTVPEAEPVTGARTNFNQRLCNNPHPQTQTQTRNYDKNLGGKYVRKKKLPRTKQHKSSN